VEFQAVIAAPRTARLSAIRDAMAEAGYDALVVAGRGVISQYGYLEYVAGYCPVVRAAYAVLGREGDVALVVPTAADAWYARRLAALDDVRVAGQGDVVSAYDDLASGVVSAVTERGAARGRVGVVGLRHIVPVAEYELLRSGLPDADLVDATRIVADVKAVKSEDELVEVRHTATIADAAFEAGLAQLRPGATGWEVSAAIEHAARARGARGEVLVFVSADPYFLGRPDARPLAAGELVTVYVEVTGPTGYWLEHASLVALGGLDDRRAALAEATLEAAGAAERELRPGRSAGDVAGALDDVVERHELRSGIWHGHGVGIDHDSPVITATDVTPLVERMVVAIHPNFSTPDESCGASVADTYIVHDGDPERLSRVPRELFRR
jgi:Xaa-Pro aminopeptidase